MMGTDNFREPRRRPYQKSRQGCTTCKARRVKCDEVRPRCGNCARRFGDDNSCVYATRPSTKQHLVTSRPYSFNTSGKVYAPQIMPYLPYALAGPGPSRVLELRLMHHYTQTTCSWRSGKSTSPAFHYPIWEEMIPQLAFSNAAVLNALLSVSALHLLALLPGDKDLAYASRHYFDKALVNHQLALTQATSENIESVLASALLIIHCSWLESNIMDAPQQSICKLGTFRLCQGTSSLVQTASPAVKSKFGKVLRLYQPQPTEKELIHVNFLKYATEDLLTVAQSLDRYHVTTEDKYAYDTAMTELSRIYNLFAIGTLGNDFLEMEAVTILHRFDPHYIELLEQEDPIALCLFARSLALLDLIPESPAWWIHGAGKSKVASCTVYRVRDFVGPDYRWAMDWPLKIINREVDLYM